MVQNVLVSEMTGAMKSKFKSINCFRCVQNLQEVVLTQTNLPQELLLLMPLKDRYKIEC